MSTIRLANLTIDQAETAVASLWLRLEEFALATPRVVVEARSGPKLDVEILFTSEADATRAIGCLKRIGFAADLSNQVIASFPRR